MSFHSRLAPKKGAWFADWAPSKRPIELPLPKLEYDSHFEVWEWRFRTLLRHNSLLAFIDEPGPSVTSDPKNNEQREELAAATHCLALLGSCISEHILAHLLTLTPYYKVLDDPYILFREAKKHVNDVQDLWKETTNPEFWGLFSGQDGQFRTVKQLFAKLEDVRNKTYTKKSWRTFILMAALLTKRNFPLCLPHSVQKYIDRENDPKVPKVDVGEKEWNDMRSEMMNATCQCGWLARA
ncbi:hypothetical protein INS49_014000 [Diaporthe citri]|uniref:uncharacterized protein n=1 Tax=Diaporthe citri TaxID=83186 RepID=UPI001C7FBEC3|nr:uncharacterized protein INS49_014000 [Diaporthe citri]KAG6358116.1 hypothetical protein INS49_014000 [Diaporthe citri]